MIQIRRDIQGLRAVAVLSVLFFHVNRDWIPGGFIGVDVFFVISGYLIASIIVGQVRDGSFTLQNFYISRVKRIVPVYAMVMAVSALVFSVLLTPEDWSRFLNSLKSAVTFYSNNYFSSHADYFAPAGHETPLIHTWSLAVEMQFYVFFPVFFLIFPSRLFRMVVVAVIVVGFSYSTYRLGQGFRQYEYYSLIARVPEFLVGALISIFPVGGNNRRGREFLAILGIVFVVAAFWLIDEKSIFPGWLAIFPAFGAFLIIYSESSFVNRVLATQVMVRIGDLSYSLYLWHWPILVAIRYFSGAYQLTVVELGVFALLTVAFSILSNRYIELPFRRLSSGKDLALRMAKLLSVVGFSILAAFILNGALVPKLPLERTRYANPEDICHEKIVGECLRGDLSSKRSVLIIGDSHAAQLNHFADVIGRKADVRFRIVSAANCVTFPGFDWDRLPVWAQGLCEKHISHAKNYLNEADAVIIAGMWQYHVGSERFLAALGDFAKSSVANEKKTIVFAQLPMLSTNVQRMYRFESLGFPHHNASLHPEWQAANDKVRALVEGIPGAYFVDFTQHAMFSTLPLYQGGLIYRDDNHLNEIGSVEFGKNVAEILAELLNKNEMSY